MNRSTLFSAYRGLPQGIYVISLAEMVNSLGNLVGPFMTLLLTQTLGYSPARTGLLITLVSGLAYVPGSLLGGRIADSLGRKRTLLTALTGSALCYTTCGFLGKDPVLIWFLAGATFCMAVAMPALSSMLTDLTNAANRKASFSLEYLGRNLGFAFGPLIAGFLFNDHLRWLFFGDALTTLIMAGLIGRFLPETKPRPEVIADSLVRGTTDEKAEAGGLLRVLWRRPALLAFAFVMMLFTFILGQNHFSLPIQLNAIFGEAGPRLYGSLMMVNGLSVVFLTTLLTSLTLRNKSVLNVALAGILLAAGYGMIYYLNATVLFWVSTVIWTGGEILMVTNANTYIADHTPMSHRGRFGSVIPLISGTGYALGPMLMGEFIGDYGIRPVWPFLGLLGLGGALLMYGLGRRETRPAQDSRPAANGA